MAAVRSRGAWRPAPRLLVGLIFVGLLASCASAEAPADSPPTTPSTIAGNPVTTAEPSTTVDGSGPAADGLAVPDVQGMDLVSAQRILGAAGFPKTSAHDTTG